MNIKIFSIHSVRNVFALFIALGLGYLAYTVNPTSVAPTKVEATSTDNVSGWAWSQGTRMGTEPADNPSGPYSTTAGSNPGIGWISLNNTTDGSATPYGVNITPLTVIGYFYGKAWSENVGWINFDQTDTATCVTSYGGTRAQVDWATGDVSGWAHAYNGSGTSGWDGCIRLSGMTSEATPQPYGVKISLTTGKFSGYAWGDSVMGWIDFAPAYAATTNPAKVAVPVACTTDNPTVIWDPCDATASCVSGGGVTQTGLTGTQSGTCTDGSTGTVFQSCTAATTDCSTYASTHPGTYIVGDNVCSTGEPLTSQDCKPKTKFWQF